MKNILVFLGIILLVGMASGFTIFLDEMPANRVFYCRDVNGTLIGSSATITCRN